MTPEEIIEKIAHSQEIIEFATTPGRAFILISNLQLALRHPENRGPQTEFLREIIANMAQAIAEVTDTPEVLGVIAAGNHPEFDMTREEAESFFPPGPAWSSNDPFLPPDIPA